MTEHVARGRMTVRDPAQAIAMAKCWLSTWVGRASNMTFGPEILTLHADECGFCDVPRDLLIQSLEEFQTWSGISTFETVPLRAEIEAFQTVSTEEQRRLVDKAAELG